MVYENEFIELLKQCKSKENTFYENEVKQKAICIISDVIKKSDKNRMKKKSIQVEIAAKKERLLQKLLDGVISDEDYKIARDKLEYQLENADKKEKGYMHENGLNRMECIQEYLDSEEGKNMMNQIFLQNELVNARVFFDGSIRISFKDRTDTVQYRHINEKSRKKEESILKIYECFMEKDEWSSSQLANKTGLSQGNILTKLKVLADREEVMYISRGKNGGYWKKCKKTGKNSI